MQQEEKKEALRKEAVAAQLRGAIKKDLLREREKSRERSRSKSPMTLSPGAGDQRRSSSNFSGSNIGLAPMNLEVSMKPRDFTLSNTNLLVRSPLESFGRRLSHGGNGESPPPIRIESSFGASPTFRNAQRNDSLAGVLTPKHTRSPTKRGQSFPVFATLKNPKTPVHYSVRSPLLSPNSELTSAIGRKLSREWGSGIDLSKSSEAIASTSAYTISIDDRCKEEPVKRKKSLGDLLLPMRRAKSHENREEGGHLMSDLGSPRIAQPVVGGKSVTQRTKKQLESELKAILTARAHHFELHPP